MTRKRRQGDPRDWYGLMRWKNRRAHQRRIQPLCVQCLKEGKVTPAKIADHIEEHEGDRNKFELGELQSLCLACHNRKTFGLHPDRLTFGLDGWPKDVALGDIEKE